MRQTIELLKKQSIQAGLTSAHMHSMGVKNEGSPTKKSLNGSQDTVGIHHNGNGHSNGNGMQRHHSTDSICSINSLSSNCSAQDKKKKKGWVSVDAFLID
jgi:neuron navigator 2